MHEKRLLILALVLISMVIVPVRSNATIAQTSDILLDPVYITAAMDDNGLTTISFEARMVNLGADPMDSLSIRIDSLETVVTLVKVNGSLTSALVNDLERYTEIIVDLGFSLETNESVWVEVGMHSSDFQSDLEVGDNPTKYVSDFIFYIRPLTSLANFTFTAILPDEATLSQESVAPLYPNTTANYTDGNSLTFVWFTDFLQPGQERVFIVKYQLPNYDSAPVETFFTQAVMIALLGIAIGAGLTYFGPRVVTRIRSIGKVKFVGVTSEEEEVLEVIRKKGGSCPQKDLYTEFDMSQAKVSLILNNLEERGLVRRLREGRENVVHIMEN